VEETGVFVDGILWKESLKRDGQQFYQYQQNEQPFKLSFHNIPYKLLISGELEYILRATDFILFYFVVRMIIALRYISGIVDHHCLEMVVHFVDIGRIIYNY
jgi:hypothetical protein